MFEMRCACFLHYMTDEGMSEIIMDATQRMPALNTNMLWPGEALSMYM